MGTHGTQPWGERYGPYEYALGDELRGERATLGKTLLDIQRDLRIKAAYIAAIEDAKPEVFPNPSFIAGYVRSYARYLGLDPDEVFHRFCQESGFVGKSGGATARRGRAAGAKAAARPAGGFRPDFAIARLDGAAACRRSRFAAIGSVLVLAALVDRARLRRLDGAAEHPAGAVRAGRGRCRWRSPRSTSRRRRRPPAFDEPTLTELASPVAATALADLYRQQELEVPILVPRDGPIAALDPDQTGLLAHARRRRRRRRDAAPAGRGAGGAGRGRGDGRSRRRRPRSPRAGGGQRWWWSPSARPGSGSISTNGTVSSSASSRRARPTRRPRASTRR